MFSFDTFVLWEGSLSFWLECIPFPGRGLPFWPQGFDKLHYERTYKVFVQMVWGTKKLCSDPRIFFTEKQVWKWAWDNRVHRSYHIVCHATAVSPRVLEENSQADMSFWNCSWEASLERRDALHAWGMRAGWRSLLPRIHCGIFAYFPCNIRQCHCSSHRKPLQLGGTVSVPLNLKLWLLPSHFMLLVPKAQQVIRGITITAGVPKPWSFRRGRGLLRKEINKE